MDKQLSLPERENPIGAVFERFPELNVSSIARDLGINPKLMHQYVSGRKKPSYERMRDIERHLHAIGEELLKVHIE